MKLKLIKLLIITSVLCFGVIGCDSTEKEQNIEIQTEEETTVEEYVDVVVEEPSEEDSDSIPETDVELE